jgi:TonB-dependent SusC/RagA subfamily outer membrane receptor
MILPLLKRVCRIVFFFGVFTLIGTIRIFAQNGAVTGVIIDAATNQGLPYANVFINNTSLGTASDVRGNFTITGITPGIVEIVVSYVGYKSLSLRQSIRPDETITLTIHLQEDQGQLTEVEVTGTRDKTWEKQLQQFEKVFLGDNEFGRQCRIQNPWVLEFQETKADGSSLFTATAARALVIENLALGYTVTYYLRSFTATPSFYSIMGDIRFQELNSNDIKQIQTWEQNRMRAWRGSYRHLFKSLIEGQSRQEGFNLYYRTAGSTVRDSQNNTFSSQINNTLQPLNLSSIVQLAEQGTGYRLRFPSQVEAHYTAEFSTARVYRDISFPVSWLDFRHGYLDVNRDGIVSNAGDLVVSGAMNEARIAHLLPNNYQPGDALKQLDIKSWYTEQKLLRLQEKVYLHTTKQYYYPGETIWYKAYFNYRTPELMDSLSRVLYVELISPENKILFTRVLPITSGMADDGIVLPVLLPSGLYELRSYTQWMMNYGDEEFFTMTVPVLNDFQRISSSPDADFLSPDSSILNITTDKVSYTPREKVQLMIQLPDHPDVQASISVAVTDMNQVEPLPPQHLITRDFPFSSSRLSNVAIPKHPIEFGISMSARYLQANGKPGKTSLLMASSNLQDAFIIDTQENGNFWVSGMRFTDSARIGFQYVQRIKKPGRIVPVPRTIPPVSISEKNLPYSIMEEAMLQRKRSIPETVEQGILLPEVVTTSTPLTSSENTITKGNYGKPDFVMSGEALRNANAFSLVDALRAYVPGLNIVYSAGTPTIRFGGPSNFLAASTNEPLLIVDGIHMYNQQDLTVYNQLFQINPLQVERVEVIKNGGAAIYGSRGANGVIIVVTRDKVAPELSAEKTTKQSEIFQTITWPGYTKPLKFQSLDYSLPAELPRNLADNRSTLYWNPSVELSGRKPVTLEFYSADTPATYRVVVEGITLDNHPIRATGYINVEPKR